MRTPGIVEAERPSMRTMACMLRALLAQARHRHASLRLEMLIRRNLFPSKHLTRPQVLHFKLEGFK